MVIKAIQNVGSASCLVRGELGNNVSSDGWSINYNQIGCNIFWGKSMFLTWVQARRSQQKKSMFSLAVLTQY